MNTHRGQGWFAFATALAIAVMVALAVHSASFISSYRHDAARQSRENSCPRADRDTALTGATASRDACPKIDLVTVDIDTFRKLLDRQERFARRSGDDKLDFSGLRLEAPHVALLRERAARYVPLMNGAQMRQVVINNQDLSGLRFIDADLTCANLNLSNLSGTKFIKAILHGARLQDIKRPSGNADQQGADLHCADLSDADLSRAWLVRADLGGADLRGALIDQTELKDSTMVEARVDGVTWSAASIPNGPGLAQLRGLSSSVPVVKNDVPALPGLNALRTALTAAGEYDLSRQVVYAIERARTRALAAKADLLTLDGLWNGLLAVSRWLLWDALTRYGLAPWRALFGLLAIWAVFSPIYFTFIPSTSDLRPTRLGRLHRKGAAVEGDVGVTLQDEDRITPLRGSGLSARIGLACQMSLVATLRVGFGPVNLGEWIARLRRTDYEIVASGAARVMIGVQSLLATLVFSIWAVALFTRPFE